MDISKMTLPELLIHVSGLPIERRTNALRQIANLTPDLKTLLKYAYHKDVKFDLPEGDPPYKEMETPENMGHNRLPMEMRKFQYFFKESNLNTVCFRISSVITNTHAANKSCRRCAVEQ